MRHAGKIVAMVIAEVRSCVRPGATLLELDKLAEQIIRKHGAEPSFKNYQPGAAPYPFPADLRIGERRDRARHSHLA